MDADADDDDDDRCARVKGAADKLSTRTKRFRRKKDINHLDFKVRGSTAIATEAATSVGPL